MGDQETGSPVRPVSSGLQVNAEPEHRRAKNKTPLVTSSRGFPSNRSSIAPAEMSNTSR
jgi:hypothetical protein